MPLLLNERKNRYCFFLILIKKNYTYVRKYNLNINNIIRYY